MLTKNKKYYYEFAKESDGEEISKLIEKNSYKGPIELIYAKRPNAYNSLLSENQNMAIVVGKSTQTNKILGMGICTINECQCEGKTEKIAYLCGFRIPYDVKGDIITCYKMLGDFCKSNNVKYTYTTVLDDNIEAKNMFSKKRKYLPEYIENSKYVVNFFGKNLSQISNLKCSKIKESEIDKLYEFINTESKNKNFFLNITEKILKEDFFNLSWKDFYILKDNNDNILCCGLLWNQTKYKQLIVKKYSNLYKFLRIVAIPIFNFLHLPKPPKENSIINYQTLSFVLSKDNSPVYLEDFVRKMSLNIDNKNGFFVYASTENAPEAKNILKISKFKYCSTVYIVNWDKTEINNINPLYIECGML